MNIIPKHDVLCIKKEEVAMIKRIISISIVILFFCARLWAMGLAVGPDLIDLEAVPLGDKVTASQLAGQPLCLEITNNSSTAFDYVIDILHTGKTSAPLPADYQDIPDTGWIIPEAEEVRIEAGQTKEVELYLNLPDDPAYSGKKYQAVIEVKSRKQRPEDIFVLAAQVRIRLSTET
jgi:hypothetical protein